MNTETWMIFRDRKLADLTEILMARVTRITHKTIYYERGVYKNDGFIVHGKVLALFDTRDQADFARLAVCILYNGGPRRDVNALLEALDMVRLFPGWRKLDAKDHEHAPSAPFNSKEKVYRERHALRASKTAVEFIEQALSTYQKDDAEFDKFVSSAGVNLDGAVNRIKKAIDLDNSR